MKSKILCRITFIFQTNKSSIQRNRIANIKIKKRTILFSERN